MEKAEKYLKEVNSLTTREELYKIGTQMQIDAWNEALDKAAGSAEVKYTFISTGDYSGHDKYIVDKQSILKLKK